MSPFLGSISTRNSRAGPTAFLAAESKASSTAATRTSRLMPFSRSQNSNTAKKSAFILLDGPPQQGNKKVGRSGSSDFGALANQQFTVPYNSRVITPDSQAAKNGPVWLRRVRDRTLPAP